VGSSSLYLFSEIATSETTETIDAAPTTGIEYTTYDDNYGLQGNVRWMNLFDNALWVIEANSPFELKRSNQGTHYDYESFPLTNSVRFPTGSLPLIFCFSINGHEIVMTRRSTFKLYNGDLNSAPVQVSGDIGTEHPWSWVPFNNLMIGRSNRGVVWFDGEEFGPMSDNILDLLESDLLFDTDDQLGYGRGQIYDDPDFGTLYFLPCRIPSDVVGGVSTIPGYLPNSGTGGTGVGLPSDDFDNNSLNTGRWTSVTGNGTLAESGGKLNASKTESSVEDVYIKSIYTLEANIHVSAKVANTAHTGSAHDVTQYLKLYYDANNYVEIGYRDVNGTLSIRSKINAAGTLQTDDVASPPASTTFRVYFNHGYVYTYYKTALGAWGVVGAVSSAFATTGWTVRLGVRCDSASSNPTFTGTFDELRVQCQDATGLTEITPEDTSSTTVNVCLVANLRGWAPKIYEDDGSGKTNERQPAWGIETIKAQAFLRLNNNQLLFFDNTTGFCQVLDDDDATDDGEMIPIVLHLLRLDMDMPGVKKICTKSKISGTWGQPFKFTQYGYPTANSVLKTVHGSGGGPQLTAVPYADFAEANMDHVWKEVLFKKLTPPNTAIQFRVVKMDYDPTFEFENIEARVGIIGGLK
jgi:hypothetical protein